MPSEELLAAMGKYNDELMKARVLLDLSGLHASSKGAHINFSGGKRTAIDGPFAESKELIAASGSSRRSRRTRQSNGPSAFPLRTAKPRKTKSRFDSCSS
jgi:YCII-related domain